MVPQTMPRVMVTGGLLVSSRGEATSSICHMSSRGDSTLSPAAAASSASSSSASACGLVLAAAPSSVAIGEGCPSSSPATFFLRGIWLAPGARRLGGRALAASPPLCLGAPGAGRARQRCSEPPPSQGSCSGLGLGARSSVALAPAFP